MSETIKISNMYLNEADIDQSWEDEKGDIVYAANAAMKSSIISKAGESSQYLTCTTLSNGEVIVDIASDTPTETKAELSKIISDAKSNRDSSLEASYKSYRQGKIEEFNASTVTVTKQFDEDAVEQSYKEQYADAKAAATQEFEDSLKDLSYSERKALKKAGFSYAVDDNGNVTTSYTVSDNMSEYQKNKLQKAVQNASTAAADAFQSYKDGLTDYVSDAKSDWTNTYNNANNNLTCEVSKAEIKKYWSDNLEKDYMNDLIAVDKQAYQTVLSSTELTAKQKAAVSLDEYGQLQIDSSKLTSEEYNDLLGVLEDWPAERNAVRNAYNLKLSVGLTKAASSGYYDSSANDVNSILNNPSALNNDIAATTNTDSSVSYEDPLADVLASLNGSTDIAVGEGSTPAAQMYVAWDPRLYKIDAFLFGKSESDTKTATGLGGLAQNALIPFGSHTVNSAFYDYSWNIESVVKNSKYSKFSNQSAESGESTQKQLKTSAETNIGSLSNKEMVSNVKDFQENSDLYGVASLMNTFTLTKLVGGLNVNIGSKKLENYMFDIRDQRRFYDSGVNGSKTEYLHASSNPTVSQLINWGNADKWGRTPYTYQDFVFSEWFGKIPNNRLITLRRYTSPTYDNLNFEDMYGAIESNGKYQPPTVEGSGTFAPVSTVVTYFGGDTGNALSSLMNFTTGTKWKDIEAQVYDVNGDQGTDPQAKVDEMLERGGFGSAENDAVSGLMGVFGNVAGRVVSFGKMSMAMKQDVGIDDELMQRMYSAQNDPYEGVYKNRVLGPINRISSVQGRDAGIEFSQSFSIVCSYKSKAIGGINPKAALLDVLGNCLTMASPTAVFWGGGYRFNVTPHAYPFHDGGWRDSFMKKIYDGKILGQDGAIATMAKGLQSMCKDPSTGQVSLESIGSNLTSLLGDGMAILGSAINSVTAMFGGSGSVGDFLTNAAGSLNGKSEEDNKKAGQEAVSNLFNNVNKMWHNKALKESTLPNLKTAGSILTGEPTGEWHLTIGNPLNPIMVIGNLICKQMEVTWDDELGPDDFPTGFKVTYTVEHAMARDNDAIQSMFNKGMGKFYVLPDYIQFSSDRMTHVDAFTQDNSSGDTGNFNFYDANQMKSVMQSGGVPTTGYNSKYISPGSRPSNSGNYNTQLITKFTPLPSDSNTTLSSLRSGNSGTMRSSNLAVIASKSVNRKLV